MWYIYSSHGTVNTGKWLFLLGLTRKNSMAQNDSSEFNDDGRYFPRWEVANKVTYKHEKGVNFHECVSHDINNTGVCLRTYEKIPTNEKVSMTIELADGVTVQAHGRAVWERNNGKDFLIGVRFEDISDKVQDLIFNCAFEAHPQQFRDKWFQGA